MPCPPDRRGRLERRVPKGRRVIPADRQDRKARRAPTATMVRLVRPEMMALPVPKGRREMKGQRVPKARKGHRVPRVRLDHKARPDRWTAGRASWPARAARPARHGWRSRAAGSGSPQGPPGEVTNAALSVAIAGTSSNSNGVALLGLVVSDPPTQAEVQQIVGKLDELINALRR
jgi:hypothetical protein